MHAFPGPAEEDAQTRWEGRTSVHLEGDVEAAGIVAEGFRFEESEGCDLEAVHIHISTLMIRMPFTGVYTYTIL